MVKTEFQWRCILDQEALDGYYGSSGVGESIQEDCRNVPVLNYTENEMAITNDIEDIMVVNTSDATYISKMVSTGQIKGVMKKHYEQQRIVFDESNEYYTSWGIKQTLNNSPGYKVKR